MITIVFAFFLVIAVIRFIFLRVQRFVEERDQELMWSRLRAERIQLTSKGAQDLRAALAHADKLERDEDLRKRSLAETGHLWKEDKEFLTIRCLSCHKEVTVSQVMASDRVDQGLYGVGYRALAGYCPAWKWHNRSGWPN